MICLAVKIAAAAFAPAMLIALPIAKAVPARKMYRLIYYARLVIPPVYALMAWCVMPVVVRYLNVAHLLLGAIARPGRAA